MQRKKKKIEPGFQVAKELFLQKSASQVNGKALTEEEEGDLLEAWRENGAGSDGSRGLAWSGYGEEREVRKKLVAQKQSSLGQVGKDDKGYGLEGQDWLPERFDGPDWDTF